MRFWYKSILVKNFSGRCPVKKHSSFLDYEKAMGGYESNEHYISQDKFFKKYLTRTRKYWDNFLTKNILIGEKILSIGSGRCINEMLLIKKKYNLVCSDLEIPDCYVAAKKILGDFEYRKLNILLNPSDEKFDCIVSLSIIHAFSNPELEIFFDNVFKSLKPNGKFLLDGGGSEDNFFSLIYDKYFLSLEVELAYLISKIIKKNYGLLKRHHGYKYKNKEILEIAKKKGFQIIHFQSADHYTEIERSKIINLIIRLLPFTKKIFYLLGSKMPYVRMFKFKRER